MTSPRLTVTDLTCGYTPSHPLHAPLSFTLTSGSLWGLVGPNGTGKTTLLRTLNGELPPLSGTYTAQLTTATIYVPQYAQVVPSLTVHDHLTLAAPPGTAFTIPSWWPPSLQQGPSRIASTLSYGEKRLLTLGAAAQKPPSILLLDEPSAGIHPHTWQHVSSAIQSLADQGHALLIVSHNHDWIHTLTPNILTLTPPTTTTP